MFFLKIVTNNLVLIKPPCLKRHAVAFTTQIFANFCVGHTYSVGGGGQVGQAYTICRTLTARSDFVYTSQPLTALQNPSLMAVGRSTHRPLDNRLLKSHKCEG
jgi:hypothetical protein